MTVQCVQPAFFCLVAVVRVKGPFTAAVNNVVVIFPLYRQLQRVLLLPKKTKSSSIKPNT